MKVIMKYCLVCKKWCSACFYLKMNIFHAGLFDFFYFWINFIIASLITLTFFYSLNNIYLEIQQSHAWNKTFIIQNLIRCLITSKMVTTSQQQANQKSVFRTLHNVIFIEYSIGLPVTSSNTQPCGLSCILWINGIKSFIYFNNFH